MRKRERAPRRATARILERDDTVSWEHFTGRVAEVLRDIGHEVDALKPDAERGRRFRDNKRGLNRLYREAFGILKLKGRDYPARLVRVALKQNGVVQVNDDSLIWTDAHGKQKQTPIHQFDSRLGAIRKRLP